MHRQVLVLGLTTMVLVLGACGAEVSDEVVCDNLRVVTDLQSEMTLATDAIIGELVNQAMIDPENLDEMAVIGAFATLANQVETATPRMLDGYRKAASSAKPDLKKALEELADYTELSVPMLLDWFGQIDSLDDLETFGAFMGTDEAAVTASQSAQLAAATVDEFAIPTCGFSVGG